MALPLLLYNTSDPSKKKQPKLNDTYGEGPNVDETALFAMALTLFTKRS
jgi:hypothetical protein